MGRLFDAGATQKQAADARAAREAVKARAAEATRILEEEMQLDDATKKMGERLGQVNRGVHAIVYETFRKPGSKWMIEHARAGDDYMFQLFPLRPPKAAWQDVILAMIAQMDTIFPRSVIIKYSPPNEAYQVRFYTIKVEKVILQPGWERACRERALQSLVEIDAWSAPEPATP